MTTAKVVSAYHLAVMTYIECMTTCILNWHTLHYIDSIGRSLAISSLNIVVAFTGVLRLGDLTAGESYQA